MGISAKALIFKALAGPNATYQQSYPQKNWICCNSLLNQRLSATFSNKHHHSALSHDY
jgi:outer membrane phospholipase A